jgi:hypothetical protein
MNLVTNFAKSAARFNFDVVAGTANFAKKATAVVGTMAVGVLAMDSYNHVYKTGALWNKLNQCNQPLPTIMNIAIALGDGPHRHLPLEKRCIEYTSDGSGIFANHILGLPFLAVGCGLVSYAFYKIESGAKACKAALV